MQQFSSRFVIPTKAKTRGAIAPEIVYPNRYAMLRMTGGQKFATSEAFSCSLSAIRAINSEFVGLLTSLQRFATLTLKAEREIAGDTFCVPGIFTTSAFLF